MSERNDAMFKVVTWNTATDKAFNTKDAARQYIALNLPKSMDWHIEKLSEQRWTLIAPDGQRFYGSTPLRAAKAEMDSRLTPEQQAANLMRALQEETSPPPCETPRAPLQDDGKRNSDARLLHVLDAYASRRWVDKRGFNRAEFMLADLLPAVRRLIAEDVGADAARYRWLCDQSGADVRSLLGVGDFTTLDAHIDRAIRGQES